MPFMAAIPAITAGAGLLGKLFGGGAKGSADQRGAENNQALQQNALTANMHNARQNALLTAAMAKDRGAMDRYGTRQGATTSALNSEEAGKLNRARLGLEAPTVRARQSVLGSMMENMQPVRVENMNPRLAGRVPTITGGLSPDALSSTTRAHGRDLQEKAMAAQFSGSDVPGATDFRSGILDAPEMVNFDASMLAPPHLAQMRGASGMEKFLGWGGLLGSAIGGIGELINEKRRPTSGNDLPIDEWGGG